MMQALFTVEEGRPDLSAREYSERLTELLQDHTISPWTDAAVSALLDLAFQVIKSSPEDCANGVILAGRMMARR